MSVSSTQSKISCVELSGRPHVRSYAANNMMSPPPSPVELELVFARPRARSSASMWAKNVRSLERASSDVCVHRLRIIAGPASLRGAGIEEEKLGSLTGSWNMTLINCIDIKASHIATDCCS